MPHSPDIESARDVSRKHNAQMCVIILVYPDGKFGGASWGRDTKDSNNWKPYCDRAGKLLDACLEAANENLVDEPYLNLGK